jgi:hypothetical protein
MPVDELHRLIRGFLRLRGVNLIVPLVDIAILIDGDCTPDDGPDVTDDRVVVTGACSAQDEIFERTLLVFGPALGEEYHERWRFKDRRGESVTGT